MGYIKLHRKLLEWEWYGQPEMTALWLHLLLSANWEEKTWRGTTIERGSLVTSIRALSKETGLSVQQVRTGLKKLQKSNQINTQTSRSSTHQATHEATQGATKITICNYDTYQGFDEEQQQTTNTPSNTQSTHQATPTKENKNIRNQDITPSSGEDTKVSTPSLPPRGAKGANKSFVPPSPEEVSSYAESIGYNLDVEHFVDYYTTNGWVQRGGQKIKDWKAAVRTWKRNDTKRGTSQAEPQLSFFDTPKTTHQ